MLHSYAFSNFRSFSKRTEVSFVLTEKEPVNGWVRVSPIGGQRLSTATAVIGANASGKTSLIQPIAFLAWFISDSFKAPPDDGIPVTPHFAGSDQPIEFEAIADSWEQDTLLRYSLTTTTRRVLAEKLEKKVRRSQWKTIFDRKVLDRDKYLVIQDEFGLPAEQASNVRPNVSLISWAVQFGVEYAQRVASLDVSTNVTQGGRTWVPHDSSLTWSTDFFANNESVQSEMKHLLGKWDFGLSDVVLASTESANPTGQKQKQWHAFGVHVDKEQRRHLLPFVQESSGTKAAFSILAMILPVLSTGGIVAFDELDSDLHPHMLEPLLRLFSNESSNPHGAQIIFTCHSAEVLRWLQKSQVVLVEKDGLESEAWRLDSMEGVRSDDNRVAKYLAGAYGAVPRL